VREIEQEDGVLIFDDTIQEKPYPDENELVCWHFDHTKGRSVKGVNTYRVVGHDWVMRSPPAVAHRGLHGGAPGHDGRH
jgi:hypothetical protein